MKQTRYLARRLTSSFALAVILPLIAASLVFGLGFLNFSVQAIQSRQQVTLQIGKSYVERYFSDGLGLAIVKSIAERHGGRVSVESAPDKGSLFSALFPTIDH